MSKVLKHALHNEKACDFLNSDGTFTDWIVTTAFYSAVHFVGYKMFPGQVPINGAMKHCEELGEYLRQIPKEARSGSIHRETINLVWQVITPIAADYERLFNLCHDARYKNYNVSSAEADLSRKLLEKIKKECNPTPTVEEATSVSAEE